MSNPICPKCGSARIASACSMWGFCNYHCLDCGYSWRETNWVNVLAFTGATILAIAGGIYLWGKKE